MVNHMDNTARTALATMTAFDTATLIADRLRSARSVLVLAHVTPDADALGSALAVGMALKSLHADQDVVVSFGDEPMVMPRMLCGLPGQELLVEPAAIARRSEAFDVAISCDVSTIDRLGANHAAFSAAATTIVVDHHVSNIGFGDINLIDPTAAANAVLALQVIDALGAELTAPIAHALYAGLITDTGNFKFSATNTEAHQMAARLLGTGMRHDLVARAMYDDEPFACLQLLGHCLSRAVLDASALHGAGFIWTTVTAADRESLGLGADAAERVIDTIRIASEAEVACVFKEDDNGMWKVSLRSKGAVDVGAVAAVLGGGGHKFAAGATLGDDVALALQDIRRALDSVH